MLLQRQRSLVLDKTYLEEVIYSLFQIDIQDLIINKVQLAKNFHIQPSEIDNMTMWEYEIFMGELNKVVKKENQEQKAEMEKYHVDDLQKMTSSRNLQKMTNPKTPDMSSMKMPNMSNMGSFKF